MQHSKHKRIFEDILNRTKDISVLLRWVIQWVIRLSEIYHGMSLTVL